MVIFNFNSFFSLFFLVKGLLLSAAQATLLCLKKKIKTHSFVIGQSFNASSQGR